MSSERLPSVSLPRLEGLFRLGERIWAARPDVREVHGTVDSWGYWCWMMFNGAGEHGDLLEALYPVPEEHLTERVTGAVTLPEFLRNGVVDANRLHLCLEQAGFAFDRPGRMLDFGCGCARITRVMARHADVLELHGCDVDADAVAWCARELDFARFAHVPFEPPTAYPDGHFQAVYGYSVFTHLSEERHLAWLRELARITAPGAAVVLTTQGRRILRHIREGRPGMFVTPETLDARQEELEERGFLFVPYGADYARQEEAEHFEEWDMTEYGMTFLLESYVREHWLEDFELVAFHDAPEDYQDFVVLRRTP